MPRRKKRQPIRRDDSDASVSCATSSKSSKQARREEDDALTVADRGFQLIKCLGLNDQLWQPAAIILGSVRLDKEVIRIHITEDPGGFAAVDALHIGRVFLLCDVAGISNILNNCTSVELRLRFNRDKSFLLVSAATLSHPRPVVLLSEVMLSVGEDTIISPELVKKPFQLHLAVHSISSVVPLLVMADQKIVEIQGSGHFSLPSVSRSHSTSRLLALLFPTVLKPDHCQPVTHSTQQRKISLSITEQILKFYQDVKVCQTSQITTPIALPTAPIPHLTAVLLNYQVDALQWMLARETEADRERSHDSPPLHFLWQKIGGPTEDSPEPLYYNTFSGMITSTYYTMPLPPRGGILADEMGLGKTVEILALILSHRWSGNQTPVLDCSTEGTSSGSVELMESVNSHQSSSVSRRQRLEKIWCVCGADREESCCDVQCGECSVWQHSSCVDYRNSGEQGYTCIRCLLKQPRPCGATLIIVPKTLLPQWLEEIDKHTDSSALSVLVYDGVAVKYHNPLHLAQQDIVMVSYETLQRELDRVHHHEFSGILRHQKRYTYPPSPLLALNWWRVCLDEAQTVETTTAKAAEMTHKLTAINRWCVTGTPIQRTLGDLYGLVYFLDHAPYCIRQWYDQLAWHPYLIGDHAPILQLFAKLMWRNTKEDVADELALPEQTEKIHWLSFSPVEEYYYNRQREMCSRTFSQVVSHFDHDAVITDFSRSTIAKLMAPLHSLRQACCHPQLVRGGYIPFSSVNKRYITMDELLKKLAVQAKQEGREHLRLLVMSLNGVAAIHILEKKWQLAVDTYREAMSCWTEQERRFDCDKLQRIHTMENLSSLLQQGHSALSRAVSDDQLDSEAAELRRQYLNKADLSLKAQVELLLSTIHTSSEIKEKALEQMKVYVSKDDENKENDEELEVVMEEGETAVTEEEQRQGDNDDDEEEQAHEKDSGETAEAEEEQRQGDDEEQAHENDSGETAEAEEEQRQGDDEEQAHENDSGITWDKEHHTDEKLGMFSSQPWWVYAIALIREQDKEDTLMDAEITNIAVSIRDLNGLQLWLSQQADKMERARSELLHALQCLAAPETPSPQFIATVCNCHLKTYPRVHPAYLCDFCEFEAELQYYAALVFQNYSFRDEEDISRRQGIFEAALNVIYSFIKKGSPKLVEAGKLHLSFLENARKEFKHMQSVWMAAEFRVRTCDELAMAAKRLRLATEEEELAGVIDLDVVLSYELGDKMMGFKQEVSFAKQSLGKAVGQLGYLHNLSIANGSDDKESCPICCWELADKWVVFPCSHSMCMECTYALMRQHAPGARGSVLSPLDFPPNYRFNCPLCRKSIVSQQLHFIQDTTSSQNSQHAAINVKGSHSTKITAVVTTLSTLQQKEPTAKSLVFSSNYEVLRLISKALIDNDIPHVYIVQKSDFQRNLKNFKSSPSLNVALMQLSSGSKGLNIVEATHVLLVEPSLNIGSEQQAIGRVHRVGQTKPTTVHRYYVRDTVEAKIKELLTNSVEVDKFISSETSCPLSVTELRTLLQ